MNNKVEMILRDKNLLPDWQILKLILSSLIVVNFYLSFNPVNKETYSLLVNVFNLTLIPMFVFISGYTTKNISWCNWRSRLIPAMIIYVTFQTIDMIPLYFKDILDWKTYLISPQNGVWFFLAVPIWQLVFLSLPSVTNSKFNLVVLLGIALILAFAAKHFLSELSGFFSIIYFFPFFIMAYFCNDRTLLSIRKKPFIMILCLVIIAVIFLYYQSNLNVLITEKIKSHELVFLFINYVFSFFIGILLGFGILYLALSTNRFQNISKNALGVYLIHPSICFVILTGLSFVGINLGISLVILFAVCTIAIALLLAKIPIINWFLNPVLTSKNK